MQTARIASSLEARLREAEAATSAAELRAVDADRAAREVTLAPILDFSLNPLCPRADLPRPVGMAEILIRQRTRSRV